MPREFDRSRRVQALLQRELADVLRSEVKDPRVGAVTIAHVRVSRDLAHARVFVSDLDAGVAERSAQALNNAAGFIRNVLKQRLRLHTIPELQFVYDRSIERGSRLYSLIEETVAADRSRHGEEPEQGGE